MFSKSKWVRHSFDSFALWLTCVALFEVGRLLFLLERLSHLYQEPFQKLDLLRAFFLGVRYDSAIGAYFSLFYFLIFLCFHGSFAQRIKTLFKRVSIASLWILLICDYCFFDYYGDHYNSFFWEFWNNFSNAELVVSSVLGEFPIAKILLTVVLGILAFNKLNTILSRTLVHWGERRFGRKPYVCSFLTLVTLVFLCRSTLMGTTLPIQDGRVDISSNAFINQVHRNPTFRLYNSYKEKLALSDINALLETKHVDQVTLKNELPSVLPGSKVLFEENKQYYKVEHLVNSSLGTVLKRKPKHIVILFLESYSSWPLFESDKTLRDELSSGMRSLIPDSAYFENHFSPGDGTLNNIIAVNYGIPLSRDFNPSLTYRTESLKDFDTKLPKLFKSQGYETQFFYGGFSQWHRLHEVVPRIGFDKFYGENSFPDSPHHDYGLHDEDLYNELLKSLKAKSGSSFTFVMTQSNHPPYRLPASFDAKEIGVPEHLSKLVTVDSEEFRMRLLCFKYADRALAQFMEKAKQEEFFKDTLFVITGDHPFYGLRKEPESYYEMSKVPLLFYAPELMKAEWKGRHSTTMTSHLDIGPSLLSMVHETPVYVPTWGMNLFAGQHRTLNLNFYINCKEPYCVVDRNVFEKKGRELQRINDATKAESIRSSILSWEDRLFYSALTYVARF